MSDFAAVAESDRFPAKWAAGDAKENELVLSADFGEGTFLSGSVWESAEGDEKPWHCIFRFSQEDRGIDDQGFDTHEEAVLAVEGYFGSAGYDVDKMSRADALLALEAEQADAKISTKDALALARIAMRTDQGLYNARTGTVLMPSVDVERGRVMGIYRAEVKLSEIVDPKSCEVIRNAWKHASFYEPDRWHDGEIGFCPTRNEHSAIDYIVRAMEKDGCGWCFADECSISAKCGLVPDRYVSVQYAPDNLDEIDEGKDALGWGDFLDAAEGNSLSRLPHKSNSNLLTTKTPLTTRRHPRMCISTTGLPNTRRSTMTPRRTWSTMTRFTRIKPFTQPCATLAASTLTRIPTTAPTI